MALQARTHEVANSICASHRFAHQRELDARCHPPTTAETADDRSDTADSGLEGRAMARLCGEPTELLREPYDCLSTADRDRRHGAVAKPKAVREASIARRCDPWRRLDHGGSREAKFCLNQFIRDRSDTVAKGGGASGVRGVLRASSAASERSRPLSRPSSASERSEDCLSPPKLPRTLARGSPPPRCRATCSGPSDQLR